jgi:zinc protease
MPAFEIPFVKYELENGLDVILHEDHSDPIVAITTLVHVGSARERPGKTGFAHFFEHMSFNDSENVPRGANRKMIGELGGLRNGGTWTDGTIYFEVVPTDALEKLMWIDSDRLGFMINTVTEWALENEKQVVKNEKRQRVDNAPYGHTRDAVLQALYPAEHPYSWSVLGSLDDLQDASLDDVRKFYDRFYGANNATLVIAGDIDIEAIKPMIERWFGEIRRGPEVPAPVPRPVELEETRAIFHADSFAKVPELQMTFPTVCDYHPDSYPLRALASVLSEGKRAQLYRVLVEEQELAPGVDAFHRTGELAGTLTIRVRAHAGVDLDDVHAAVTTAFERFAESGFLEEDLLRIKAKAETELYEDASSVLDRAFQLAAYNEFAGDPGYATEEVRRIQSVTREDVIAAFDRYVRGKNYVVTSFVPRGEEELIVDGSTEASLVEEKIVQGAEVAIEADPNFEYEITDTRHDRTEPALGPPPVLDPPEIWSAESANGMRVLGIVQRELPLFEISLAIRGGHVLDPPGKSGVAVLLGDLMMEGTEGRTPEELEDAIGALGADISVSGGRELLTLSASGLARNYRAVLELVEEILLSPRWDPTEFERLKRAQLNAIRTRKGESRSIASDTLNRVLYGDDHVFAIPTVGTTASVSSITLDDLKTYHAKSLSPSLAAFHVAGDVSRSEVTESLAGLAERWKSKEIRIPEFPLPESRDEPALFFVDVPGSKQSMILVGRLALTGNDDDYNKLVYANNRLGAGSSARLFQLLRIEKGYTYGAGSIVPRLNEVAPFYAATSVRANVTLESLELIRDQIRNYRATYTEDDLRTTKNQLVKQATRDFETLDDLISVLEDITRFDLPLDFIDRGLRELEALTLEQVHATIERYLDESRMVYVVVGDAATQRERLAALGYGDPVILDVHGNAVDDRVGG